MYETIRQQVVIAYLESGLPLADFEMGLRIAIIQATLEHTGGNRVQAARRLNMHRNTLARSLSVLRRKKVDVVKSNGRGKPVTRSRVVFVRPA